MKAFFLECRHAEDKRVVVRAQRAGRHEELL